MVLVCVALFAGWLVYSLISFRYVAAWLVGGLADWLIDWFVDRLSHDD